MKPIFNNNLKGFILAFAIMLMGGAASAKPFTIKGTVSDQDNYPLAGAAVQIEGTSVGTMADEKGVAIANCHFCNKNYIFTKSDLEKLIEEKNS